MALQTAPRMVSWSHSCSKRQVEHLWPLPDLSVWAGRGTSWERCTSAHGLQAKEACSSISAPQTSFPVRSLIYSGLCHFPVTVCNSNKFLSLNLLFWNLPQVQFIMFLRNISRPCRQTPVQCCYYCSSSSPSHRSLLSPCCFGMGTGSFQGAAAPWVSSVPF